jgi:GNAT superfamily N-acetyltransferase
VAILSRPEAVFGDVLVRPAGPGEVDVVLDLLAEAAAWLRSRGIEQWPRRFPAESVQGALLVEKAGRPIATLAVADEDSALWGPDTAPAYYVSRLAVGQHGTGLGHRLIDWVSGKAVEHGRQYVRLATARDNPALRRYYERAGFLHVADPPGARWPTSLYERSSSRSAGSSTRSAGSHGTEPS